MAKRKKRGAERNGRRAIDWYADEAARHVIAESTRIYLEKIVGEAVKQDLEDPDFRAELREAGRRAYGRANEGLLRRS